LVTVGVSDGKGGQDSQSFTLFVTANSSNQDPRITSSPPTSVGLGRSYTYAVRATDPDGDPLSYRLLTAPAGMVIDAGGLIRWTPTAAQFGPSSVNVCVEDGRGGVAEQPFTVNVGTQPSGQNPSITSTPLLAATIGRQYTYDLTGNDPEGTPLVW